MPPRSRPRPPSSSSESIPRWGWWVIGGFLGIILLTIACISGFAAAFTQHLGTAAESIFSLISGVGLLLGLAALYFLPTLIAWASPRKAAIFVANLVFGWTIIGWIIILIWALAEAGTMNKKPTP